MKAILEENPDRLLVLRVGGQLKEAGGLERAAQMTSACRLGERLGYD